MMKVSEKLAQGRSLPRGTWHGVDPRTKVVPARKGQSAPYRRHDRRRRDELVSVPTHPPAD